MKRLRCSLVLGVVLALASLGGSITKCVAATGALDQSSLNAIGNFFDGFWNVHASNEADDWAAFFAPVVTDYQYIKGSSVTRDQVARDRRKLIIIYPKRLYRQIDDPAINVIADSGLVEVRFSYAYNYTGRKNASGSAKVRVILTISNGKAEIVGFTEKVSRT